jgi:hypothetical protein
VEHDLLEERARKVRTRFELAVRRMMNAWLAAGRIRVSPADVKLACEFLEDQGCHVEDVPGAYYRLAGEREELTGEATVLTAMRRLAGRGDESTESD